MGLLFARGVKVASSLEVNNVSNSCRDLFGYE
jgi:hypothetical protein